MQLRLGQKYSRKEISKLIGGSTIAYLPYKDGQVLCGCFKRSRSLNPDAPEEVVYGPAPIVEETAKMIHQQKSSIPIFIFRSHGQWEYIGDYRCVKHSRDSSLLKDKMREYPERGEIAGVLYFEKI